MAFLYIDAVGGAAGDMLLAAFFDGLVPFYYFREQIGQLPLPDYDLSLQEVKRHAIGAKHFVVKSTDRTPRHLSDIEALIEKSTLSSWVKEQSLAVFRELGQLEAEVHQVPLEKVHFHEVGAVDSIIDIVGFFICLEFLSPEKVFTSPLPVSRGIISAAHGKLPVPAPATLEILKDYPVVYRSMEAELVTPTGAILIKHVSDGLLPTGKTFEIQRIGYGAGTKDFQDVPNLLRIWEGQFKSEPQTETLLQIETNIDDLNPEIYPYLQQKLFERGALDVSFYPNIMKKGRPGVLITVLAERELLPRIRTLLYRETTTLGFRYFPVSREKLPRRSETIDSPWGSLNVKVVTVEGEERYLPEFEECRRIAEETGEPLLDIYRQIQLFLTREKK